MRLKSTVISGLVGIILTVGSPTVRAATYGQQVVAAVLMAEAWGEGREGMIAVAEVIRNRADKEGISPLAIVKQPRQFTSLNNTTPPQLIRKFWKARDWEIALEISRMLYNEPEKLPGITNGADHYDNGRPYWAKGRTPVAVVGSHKFYRLY